MIVINGLRWLFRSDPEGLNVIRWLGRRISEDSDTSWLIVADSHVWKTLEGLSPFGNFLSRVFYLSRLSKEELRLSILSRHQMSGYEIFYPDNESVKTKIWKFLGQFLCAFGVLLKSLGSVFCNEAADFADEFLGCIGEFPLRWLVFGA